MGHFCVKICVFSVDACGKTGEKQKSRETQYLVSPHLLYQVIFTAVFQSARPIASETGSDSTRPWLRVFIPTAFINAAIIA